MQQVIASAVSPHAVKNVSVGGVFFPSLYHALTWAIVGYGRAPSKPAISSLTHCR
jgi:hypothetical protein